MFPLMSNETWILIRSARPQNIDMNLQLSSFPAHHGGIRGDHNHHNRHYFYHFYDGGRLIWPVNYFSPVDSQQPRTFIIYNKLELLHKAGQGEGFLDDVGGRR